jgi:hypothetical protein
VVTKAVDDFQVVSGQPARVINDTHDLDRCYLSDPRLMEWYREWQDVYGAEPTADQQEAGLKTQRED